MPDQDDVLAFLDDEPPAPSPTGALIPARSPWRILIADDDADVHESTAFALRGLEVGGRPLQLLHARSAAEARDILRHTPDIAVLLLDVVMETDQAGLDLVDEVRGALGLSALRIILRTGQPGQAPELDTIRRYDINAYKTKSELTRAKLFVTLLTAIRSYDQLCRLDATRRGLEKVVEASNQFIAEQGLVAFAEGVVLQIAGLLGLAPDGLLCACLDSGLRPAADGSYRVIAAAGQYRHLIQQQIGEIDNPHLVGQLRRCLDGQCNVYGEGDLTLFFPGRGMRDFAAYIASPAPLSETDLHLLEVFCTNITLCAANVTLVSRLRELAYTDRLVGLPNRLATIEYLDARLAQGELQGQVLVRVDIEQFTETNDMFGHRFGDAVLQAVAQRLVHQFAPACFVARVAGNTFVLVGDEATLQAEALAALLDLPVEVDGIRQRLSLRMSFVRCGEFDRGADGTELLQGATLAMKRSRLLGQGRTAYYTRATGADARDRTRLLQGLHRAFDHDRLFLVYQPKVHLATGAVAGVEALLRWRAEDGQLVPPDRFIPVAEQSGLIVPLGLWVLRSALRDLAALPGLQVSVNVSAVQLAHAAFLPELDQALQDSGIAPQRLELEMTESVAAMGLDRVAATMQAVRARGVGVAIDDFGTGYSSLSYLDRLPASRLKIDRAFVELLDTSRPGARIARMIVPLGHQLGMRVVAEGVETSAQMDLLKAMGCDEVQGYALARPMPLVDLQAWLVGRPLAGQA